MVEYNNFGPLADFTNANTVDEKPDVGVFEALGASLRQSTSIGSFAAAGRVQQVDDTDAALDQAFTKAEIMALPSVYQPYAERFVGTTKQGAVALRENIDGELRDKETLGRLSMVAGFASDAVVQFADPINYLPMGGLALKGGSLSAKLAKGAAGGLIGAALQEPILFSTQETRTLDEVKANLIASAAFGAAFGGAYHAWEVGRSHWGDPKPATRQAPVDLAPLKNEVGGHIKTQLEALGYDPADAGHNADIFAAAYGSIAARSGSDPVALAEAFKVRFANEASAAEAVAGGPDVRAFDQFAGERARTADLDAQKRAKELIAGGAYSDEVWRETGWFLGVDEKWRFEVSDHAAELLDNVGTARAGVPNAGDVVAERAPVTLRLGDVMKHDALFEAYPALEGVKVTFDDSIKSSAYMEVLDDTSSGSRYNFAISINPARQTDKAKMLSVLLHEVQHGIQSVEGFAWGGGVEHSAKIIEQLTSAFKAKKAEAELWPKLNTAPMAAVRKQAEMLQWVQLYASAKELRKHGSASSPSGVFRHIRNNLAWFYSPVFKGSAWTDQARDLERRFAELPKPSKLRARNEFLMNYSHAVADLFEQTIPPELLAAFKADKRQIKSLENAYRRELHRSQSGVADLDALRADARALGDQADAVKGLSAYEVYMRLYGEIEARNTQARAAMSPDERRLNAPRSTQDRPDGQAIVQSKYGIVKTDRAASETVSSPEFKKWFGDSKVVDADGKPMVVYHATGADFDAFDTTIQSGDQWFGQGSYFATDKDDLDDHLGMLHDFESGRVVDAYLSINNPYRFDRSSEAKRAALVSDLADAGVILDGDMREFNGETLMARGADKFTAWAKSQGFDGVFAMSFDGNSVSEIVAFEPTQIKAVDNRGGWSADDPRILYQSDAAAVPDVPEAPLYVVHNLSAEKLRHVTDLGGLAAPSIAIARGDIGFDNFGEISLLGDPALANPKGKGVRAFNADVYSPRQPRARFKLDKAASRKIAGLVSSVSEKLGLGSRFSVDDMERGGLGAVEGETAIKAAWLQSNGETVPVVRVAEPAPEPLPAYQDFSSVDWYALKTDPAFIERVTAERLAMVEARREAMPELADKIAAKSFGADGALNADVLTATARSVASRNIAIRDFDPEAGGPVDRYKTALAIDEAVGVRDGSFRGWVSSQFGDAITGKFFETETGKKRDYTLGNIVAAMTKTVRGGENWNYGVGNIRAMMATEFVNIGEVKAARGSIVSPAETAAMKDTINAEFFALADKFAPYHREGERMGWGDTFAEFLTDYAKGPRARDQWLSSFSRVVPDDLMQEAALWLEKLRSLPTDYFEIKMQRAVALSEFKAALVPDRAPPETVKALEDAGLEVVRYGKEEGARNAALQQFSGRIFFQSDAEFEAYHIAFAEAAKLAAAVGTQGGNGIKFRIKAAMAKGAALNELAAAIDKNEGGIELKGKDSFAAVTKSQDALGGWRVTYFDENGFIGHSEFETKLEAVKSALADGYNREAAGALRNAMKSRAFFQRETAKAAPRGSIEFSGAGPLRGQTLIRLMGGADASTFMHESAHFFLEVMNDLDAASGGKSDFAADIAEIEAWAGKRGADGKFGRDAHEKFARGFEQYLRAGVAPSPALSRAFEAFKEWLLAVYASAARLNADVSPEMARVYDRLLVPDVSQMAGAYPSPSVRASVGAAASGDMAMLDANGEYRALTASDFALRNGFARAVERSGAGLTPNNRAARSKMVSVKQLMAAMVEDQRDTEASRQGAVTTAVETLIKNDRGLAEARLYAIFGKNGKRLVHPTLSPAEFGERVLNALANPSSEPDALVLSVADRVHAEVIAPLEKQMRDIGMLAKVQKWSKDGRYAPHNWSSGKILSDLPRFRQKMGDRIKQALRMGYKVEIDKADKRKTNLLREIDQLEKGSLLRRDELQRRIAGNEVNLTEPEIRDLMMQARNKPDEARPKSLRQFVVAQGGFWLGDPLIDEIKAMEYRAVGFTKRERRRDSAAGNNGGGLPVDMMREAAEEAGYLPEGSTINDLLDALHDDVANRKRAYARADLNEVGAWDAYDELLDSLAQLGIYFDGKPILRKSSEVQRVYLARAMDAMDKIDAVEVERLRAKVKEIDGEVVRSQGVLDDAEEFDDEVALILDEVTDKLTKQDAIWAEDLSITVDRAGPLKRRSIDVMRNSFSEFMDNTALEALGAHMHRMIAEYHLTKRFGRADMKHDIESMRAEAKGYAATLTGKDRLDFDKKMLADVAMIQTTRDQLRGTHAKGQTGFFAEAARFMSAASYTLQLGDVVTSSVGDALRPVMAHGAGLVMRRGLPRLREGLRQIWGELPEGDYLRSDRAGVVVERIASSRMMSMMDLEDTYHPNTKATRFGNNLAGLATRVSLMDRWNQLNKWISAGLFMDRLGEMAGQSWDKLKPSDQAFLSINRISENQWGYVADQIKTYGRQERGVWVLNFERWADAELASTVRAAMRKDIDAVIVTPSLGDKIQTLGGMDMTSPMGKAVMQYKSFWISGHERIMLRAAQNPDAAATAAGALLMVVVGMMIDEVKAVTGNRGHAGEGYDWDKRWADRNFGTMVMGGLDRSGLIPMWMEANNVLERGLGLPLAYRAAGLLGMAAGAENIGDPSSRWASRNTLGSFLGPSAGVIQDVVQVARDTAAELQGADEGISKGTITAAKSLIPFQNAPIIRPLLNWFVIPALKDAVG